MAFRATAAGSLRRTVLDAVAARHTTLARRCPVFGFRGDAEFPELFELSGPELRL